MRSRSGNSTSRSHLRVQNPTPTRASHTARSPALASLWNSVQTTAATAGSAAASTRSGSRRVSHARLIRRNVLFRHPARCPGTLGNAVSNTRPRYRVAFSPPVALPASPTIYLGRPPTYPPVVTRSRNGIVPREFSVTAFLHSCQRLGVRTRGWPRPHPLTSALATSRTKTDTPATHFSDLTPSRLSGWLVLLIYYPAGRRLLLLPFFCSSSPAAALLCPSRRPVSTISSY